MAIDAAMGLVNRLLADAQTLAAITAFLRAQAAGQRLEPNLAAAIERVIDAAGARSALDDLTDGERDIVVAFARSYLHQAIEIIDDPWRPNAWSHSDPTILQAQGAASGVVAQLIQASGLGRPSMRILDIGTGVGGLAIALAQTFPGSTVAGIDPWEPSLALARDNVREAGLQDRIALHAVPIQDYSDGEGFDLAWLPSFFIPPDVVAPAAERVKDLLRPGGHIVVGVVEGSDEPLAGAVDAMVTVRSGGSLMNPAEAIALLSSTGFSDTHEVQRTWRAPLRLVAGTNTP